MVFQTQNVPIDQKHLPISFYQSNLAQAELECLAKSVIPIRDSVRCTALSTNSGEFPCKVTRYIA